MGPSGVILRHTDNIDSKIMRWLNLEILWNELGHLHILLCTDIVKLQEQAPIRPVQTGKYFNSEKPLLISFVPTFNHTKCGYLVGMWVSEGPKMALS